jgi:hypothetical protein
MSLLTMVEGIAAAFPNIMDLGLFGPLTGLWGTGGSSDSILVTIQGLHLSPVR